ncbi:WD-repeat protein, putative [Ricinus communis]|uniref:WD-repeat protein, putative n=1 Tax=Ricinus communis TaxID=3988 RepID=B9RNE9_RICCO|nr:WD-repeat protein, putative [Ricinus communis]
MDLRMCSSISKAPLSSSNNMVEKAVEKKKKHDFDVDLREVYFLILSFLSSGPCQRTADLFWNELLEHELLPRRYHAWFSRSGVCSGNDNDDGVSLPLNYNKLVERYPHIEKDHLIKLLKQLLLHADSPVDGNNEEYTPNAAKVPTLLGSGSFSLLDSDRNMGEQVKRLPVHLRWPHMQAHQVHGLGLREIGGGFAKHQRAPSFRCTCYAIAKPSTMVPKMQNIKKLRGHRDAVYCAIFDRSGRYVITGSDDRLVKIWSMETAFCLASCRGHEGDITDLAVSSNNALVASASNDFVIRVWRLPDGLPISVLRGHTGAVTAIAFSPRPNSVYQLLSSSDDGSCRIWDARYSQCSPRIYAPRPADAVVGKNKGPSSNGPSSSNGPHNYQILCCAYNANGTVFVTGSSDTYARVWSACKSSTDESDQPIYEIDVLSGHENDVNYVQFSGCAVASRSSFSDALKEDNIPKFKNSWFCHDKIVTCSRDGSAIIWTPTSRNSHGKSLQWGRSYHLKVPPPPLPPQPPRGGPRQRILPTPRGVNMIVWSLDNRFVLAAIMDCRICVWNASDGNLVHSLTGHTASSYVLDVHPFDPRIAMSAGYDGRTIVWDIWEGIPVRIYEIGLGRFKLVDGKFSPDGTSIVLSDDVGQIHLLNTGQGECQKDAKYDQFFLGDYRPLIRDSAGNVLDQETQLPPYRRNVQDPLCDSSMVPYPEPYQTMFQKRRLGALSIEWHPPSIKFAVGPDFSLGLDYQMPPLEDLDRMIESLPEFIDAIHWEPEIEVISDDNDSEYNVTEECNSEEHGSLCCSSASDPECSTEDSDIEHSPKDGLPRSRRRKHKTNVSSGSPISMKRNLNERDESTPGSNGAKKLKSGRKVSKRKSSKATSSRPQRVAARNALTMFSKMTGTSTDGDDDDLEDDTSSSESGLLETEDIDKPPQDLDSQSNAGCKKKLIVKLSLCNSKKPVSPEDSVVNVGRQIGHMTPSPETGISLSSKDLVSSSSDAFAVDVCQNRSRLFRGVGHPEKVEDGIEGSPGDNRSKIRWGEVNDCTSKRSRDFDLLEENEFASTSHCQALKDNPPPKIRLKIKQPSKPRFMREVNDLQPDAVDIICKDPSYQEQNLPFGAQGKGEDSSRSISLYDHIKEQSHKTKDDLEDWDYSVEENASNAMRRTRSMKMKATSREPHYMNLNLRLKVNQDFIETSKDYDIQLLPEERMPNSRMTVRSRSARNRLGNNDTRYPISIKPSHPIRKLSWLILSKHEGGYRYIPQLGDEVVYLRQGHLEYIESVRSEESGPWSSSRRYVNPVETCRVERIKYGCGPGGDSCCKIMLRFIDPSSGVFGEGFELTLLELTDFPDFVVEKAWYDAAINRNWTRGDKCQVWWRNANGEDGSWWDGRIVSSKAKSEEYPDSPWERYRVQYETDPDEENLHSPWELHDPDMPWEHPHIDSEIRDKLLSAFDKLEESVSRKKDSHGIQKLNETSQKPDFFNKYPVPFYPEIIRSRLENNYYRTLEAVKHDIHVMMENAQSYFAGNKELSHKMRRLSEWYSRKLSKILKTET